MWTGMQRMTDLAMAWVCLRPRRHGRPNAKKMCITTRAPAWERTSAGVAYGPTESSKRRSASSTVAGATAPIVDVHVLAARARSMASTSDCRGTRRSASGAGWRNVEVGQRCGHGRWPNPALRGLVAPHRQQVVRAGGPPFFHAAQATAPQEVDLDEVRVALQKHLPFAIVRLPACRPGPLVARRQHLDAGHQSSLGGPVP